MTDVPAAMPVTTPDRVIAALALPEDHVPPPTASERVRLPPTHTIPTPLMAAGDGLTVTIAVTIQSEPKA